MHKLTLPYSHAPSLLPIAWQVIWQKSSPKVHLEGKSSRKSSRLMGCSLHLKWIRIVLIEYSKTSKHYFLSSYQHLLSSSQSPVFWPRILQPSEQAESPKKHRNPASETYAKHKVTKIMANFLILRMKITCLSLLFN